MTEQIVETKKCMNCGVGFSITDKDLEFYDKVSPVFGGKKFSIPSPKMCSDCRKQRRLTFRNFFNLYRRQCDATGRNIISMYHADCPFPVYEMHEWWSDKWSGLDYGVIFDFQKPFFDQLQVLHDTVPKMNIMDVQGENCDYSNISARSKNCYLMFGNVDNEDCCYGHIVWKSLKCFDCLYVYESEYCYSCVDCLKCYKIFYGVDVEECVDSQYLYHCKGCQNCFGCVGLNQKSYCIFNQQFSKEEYLQKVEDLAKLPQDQILSEMDKLLKTCKVNYSHGYQRENVTGDYLYHSKNIVLSYDLKNSENVRYSATLDNYVNCWDCNYSSHGELFYNCISGSGYHIISSHNCFADCTRVFYSDNCYYCEDCFGCVGLKNKSYCIFNKQYSKEEYGQIVSKIIEKMMDSSTGSGGHGEWGEFFPNSMSPFTYNETMAQEYFPLTKEQVLEKGYEWRESEDKDYNGVVYVPLSIENYADENTKSDLLNGILKCEVTGRPFRIVKQELEFYLKHKLSIPTKHPDQRHKERMTLRNPRKLRKRSCNKCKKEIQTTYSPECPEIVYCEKCYNKEIY